MDGGTVPVPSPQHQPCPASHGGNGLVGKVVRDNKVVSLNLKGTDENTRSNICVIMTRPSEYTNTSRGDSLDILMLMPEEELKGVPPPRFSGSVLILNNHPEMNQLPTGDSG